MCLSKAAEATREETLEGSKQHAWNENNVVVTRAWMRRQVCSLEGIQMTTEISVARLVTRESPRQILRADFPTLPDLPIRGGWGYDGESVVIIDKSDPSVPEGIPFDGVGVEYAFADRRLWEELIIFRPKGSKLAGIRKKLIEQQLRLGENGGRYDVLTFQVTALPEDEWDTLKTEWEGPEGFQTPNFDHEAHMRRHEAATVTFVAEYWFEISSFYGQKGFR